MHVEETSSGNLDLCFRLGTGTIGAFKCDSAPEALRLWDRIKSLRELDHGQHSPQVPLDCILNDDEDEMPSPEADEDYGDATEYTEATEQDTISVAEFSMASARSKKTTDGNTVASLISALSASRSPNHSGSPASGAH